MNRKSTPNQPANGDEKLGVHPRELMLYLDGELDDAQLADIEGRLPSDRDARCHVSGMQLTGSLLRERTAQSPAFSAADSIADLVMARIAKGDFPEPNAELDSAPAPLASAAEVSNGVASGTRTHRHASGRDAHSASPDRSPDGSRPSQVAPKSLPHIGIPPSKRTANDNARTIWALTAVAVAAAAAFMIWGKTADGPVADPVRPSTTQALPDEPGPDFRAQLPPDTPTTPDTEVAGGVEVATVDFGQTQGSVFYVPGSSGETTTVVWLADDEAAGGEQ